MVHWLVVNMDFILTRRIISIYVTFVLIFTIDPLDSIRGVESLSDDTESTVPKVPNALRGFRVLSVSTITTPNCLATRTAPYPTELHLFYTYAVEINDDLLLSDMERAINNAVAIELNMCDHQGRPVYKVRTSTTHSFSSTGTCNPISVHNTCIVVNGETAVLLDENSDANFVRNRVYIGIAHGLGDASFLNGFTNSVVSAVMLSEGYATLVENQDEYNTRMDGNEASYHSGVTTTVAVAAASVTIVVVSIFFSGGC